MQQLSTLPEQFSGPFFSLPLAPPPSPLHLPTTSHPSFHPRNLLLSSVQLPNSPHRSSVLSFSFALHQQTNARPHTIESFHPANTHPPFCGNRSHVHSSVFSLMLTFHYLNWTCYHFPNKHRSLILEHSRNSHFLGTDSMSILPYFN